MLPSVYEANLKNDTRAVVFINGIIARNRQGFLWLWRNLMQLQTSTAKAPGCSQVKAGICSAREIVMVSYWQDQADLTNFYRTKFHASMMKYVAKNPDNLVLYNETYLPSKPGKYSNEAQGMARIVGKVER